MTVPPLLAPINLALLVFLTGCTKAPPTPRDLIGKAESEVIAMMGAPNEKSEWVTPQPGFGPRPESLPNGSAFTNWFYRDFQGEQWHIMLVTPEVYRDATGADPGGDGTKRVLDVASFPVGAVF